jgi:hypothetical protein
MRRALVLLAALWATSAPALARADVGKDELACRIKKITVRENLLLVECMGSVSWSRTVDEGKGPVNKTETVRIFSAPIDPVGNMHLQVALAALGAKKMVTITFSKQPMFNNDSCKPDSCRPIREVSILGS